MIGLSQITGLFGAAGKIVDAVHTSAEEKLQLKNEFTALQTQVMSGMLEYEKSLVESQSKIVTAEATGKSWLQRNWRPITMMVFLLLVVCDSFGWLVNRLADQAWTLLQLGLGGYVVGRSAEKVTAPIIGAIKDFKRE